MDKTIGGLNGRWALLAKAMFAAFPFVLILQVWLVSETFHNQYFREEVARWTISDAQAQTDAWHKQLHLQVQRIDTRIDALPPEDWRERIKKIETTQELIRQAQTRSLIVLESIKTRLDRDDGSALGPRQQSSQVQPAQLTRALAP